jgi:hypothetical protein
MLKKANIHVEEDLSKRTRENRTELRKFMRQVRILKNANIKQTLIGSESQSGKELFPAIRQALHRLGEKCDSN